MENLKNMAFLQSPFVTSATQQETLGTKRFDRRGNIYRYAKAGSTALSAGKMTVAAGIAAAVTNKAAVAAAAGTKALTLTVASATYPANYFAGGDFHINDADGEGYKYEIATSSAVAAGTSISITLVDGIKKALTTSSEFTLVHSPFMATAISTTEESEPTGVPLVDVPANHYYWSQTGGEGICLIAGTPAVGSNLTLSSTAGALTTISATIATTVTQPICAIMRGTAGVAGEYKPVKLLID